VPGCCVRPEMGAGGVGTSTQAKSRRSDCTPRLRPVFRLHLFLEVPQSGEPHRFRRGAFLRGRAVISAELKTNVAAEIEGMLHGDASCWPPGGHPAAARIRLESSDGRLLFSVVSLRQVAIKASLQRRDGVRWVG